MTNIQAKRKGRLNLQEFQTFDIANFLRNTPTHLVPHKVPLENKEEHISEEEGLTAAKGWKH